MSWNQGILQVWFLSYFVSLTEGYSKITIERGVSWKELFLNFKNNWIATYNSSDIQEKLCEGTHL